MSKYELTDWYPPEIKPVRKGLYERRWTDLTGPYYAYWDGMFWHHSYSERMNARYCNRKSSIQNGIEWRGRKQP